MIKKLVTGLFLTFAIFVLAGIGLVGCAISVRGSGNVVTEGREVSGFDRVALDGMGEIVLTQGDSYSLIIEAEENLMQYIKSTVRGDELTINIKSRRPVIPSKRLKFYITVPNLEGVSVDGAGSINIGSLDSDTLELDINGSGNITIDELDASSVVVQVDGVGDINLTGEIDSLEVGINGSGNFNGKNLESKSATVDINGVGNAKVNPQNSLDANIDGAGQVVYYDSPAVSKNINGVGRVVQR